VSYLLEDARSSPTGYVEAVSAWSAHAGASSREEQVARAAILRDLLGSLPFRRLGVEAGWLAWNDGTVARLASACHAERAFDRLPVLADALEEAGCGDADVLGHLRGPGPHFFGCFVLDLLLGKE
jgi:hypothetical protein